MNEQKWDEVTGRKTARHRCAVVCRKCLHEYLTRNESKVVVVAVAAVVVVEKKEPEKRGKECPHHSSVIERGTSFR